MGYSTGWFGIPGKVCFTKVHVCLNDKPVCGSRVRPSMEYQWCANWVCFDYLECEHCKAWERRRQIRRLESMGNTNNGK